MAKKKNDRSSSADNSAFTDEPVMTAQQRTQQAKAERKAEKEKKRLLRQELYAEAKTRLDGGSRGLSIALVAIICAMVVGCALLLIFQPGGGWDAKEGMTYFLDNAELPEIGESGMSACINEAYYTENGGMCIRLTLGNGEPTTQHPVKIGISLRNAAGEVIAAAATTSVPKKYFVVAGGQKGYTLRIKKEYVKISDDPLSEIRYDIHIDSEWYESTEGD